MQRFLKLGVVLVLVSLPVDGRAADVLGACAEDIESYCSNVTIGHGRLISCLYAHEDLVSDQCDAAFGDAAAVIDAVFAELREVQEACGDDIRTMCADIPPGEGRIFSCLKSEADDVSSACRTELDTIALPTQ